jgi:hypothetical protein
MRRNQGTSVRLLLAAAAMGAMSVVAGCGGTNLFSVSAVNGGGGATGGSQAPVVQILNPPSDTVLSVGDSVFVRARLTAGAAGVASARMYGFAHRGVDSLGTGQDVPRFTEKDITFAGAVTDTTVVRYLAATADTTHETVYLVVEATDSAGNTGADTISVSVGGLSPVASIWSGRQVDGNAPFRVPARSSHRLDRVATSTSSGDSGPLRIKHLPAMPAYSPYEKGTPSRRRSNTW